MRFAYGFGFQLVSLEAAAFFRFELPRGDDSESRFILDLEVNDEEQPSEKRVAHDLHAALIVVPGFVLAKLRERIREDGDGLLEGDAVLAPVRESLRPVPDESDAVELKLFVASSHGESLQRSELPSSDLELLRRQRPPADFHAPNTGSNPIGDIRIIGLPAGPGAPVGQSESSPSSSTGPTSEAGTNDAPDDALRMTIRAALEAGDLARVDVREASPKPAPVVSLATRRGP